MILVFTLVNALALHPQMKFAVTGSDFFGLFILTALFFFRMRLFDEIKDYETDLRVNPTRPLARGLITVGETKRMILVSIFFEVLLAATFGKATFAAYVLALGYSLLMYREFFMSDFLRSRLTTYAVSHTIVSVLIGLFIALGAQHGTWDQIHRPVMIFLFSNWFFFNLFEFARKTFHPSEERPTVDSYSSLFGLGGAIALSVSQVFIGLLFLFYALSALQIPLAYLHDDMILAAIYAVASIVCLFARNQKAVAGFRAFSGAYLICHYILFFLAAYRK